MAAFDSRDPAMPVDLRSVEAPDERSGAPSDFDALADMFLDPAPPEWDAEVPEPSAPRAQEAPDPFGARDPMIEVVVQGHLPVRAAPWMNQYAQALSREGAVALVRESLGTIAVEVFDPAGPPSAEFGDAGGAIQEIRRKGLRVLIATDEAQAAALARDPRVGALTVLTGVSETSLVAAYRTIKGVIGTPGEAGSRAGSGLSLQLGVMGASRAEAARVLERVGRASRAFLSAPVRLSAVVERVGPTSARALFRGPGALTPGDLIDALCSGAGQAFPGSRPGGDAASGRAETPRRARPGAGASPSREALDPEPAGLTPHAGALASYVEGLTPCMFRCPDEPGVDLAWDEQGSLHLLAHAHEEDAIASLLAASAWALKHAALLAAASGQDPGRALPRPVLHLFAQDPRRARRLMDAGVHLHILARATGPLIHFELT